jgi:hypothetical protein
MIDFGRFASAFVRAPDSSRPEELPPVDEKINLDRASTAIKGAT